MARRIILMRHARAEGPGAVGDVERPLTAEGRLQALAMGRLLRDVPPDRVATSPARRCRETADLVLEGLGASAPVTVHDELFADDAGLLPWLVDAAGTTLVVSHEPTLATLGALLVGPAPGVALRPGHVAVIEGKGDDRWTLVGFRAPG